jgi:hypothetical protein
VAGTIPTTNPQKSNYFSHKGGNHHRETIKSSGRTTGPFHDN